MKKNKNKKTSLIILCAILTIHSLSSCVDGDYYDLYDDENECSFLRKKRSKDSEGYAAYPDQFLASEQFFYAECGACCYKNLTGSSNVNARKALISQMHGGVITDEYIRSYYFDIMYIPAEVQATHVLNALCLIDSRWSGENVINVVNYLINEANNGRNILTTKDMAVKGTGHIAKVIDVNGTEEPNTGIITYNFYIVDQYSDYNYYPCPREQKDHYYINIDRYGHFLGTDIDCFIWKNK